MSEQPEQVAEEPKTEAAVITDEERKLLDDFIKDLTDRFAEKVAVRDLNNRRLENESRNKKREANVKKNAAFVKKLKTVTENQHNALLTEAAGLDLTRYLAEIVQALTHDCKLKISDVPFVVKFCCHLHRTYDEFAHLLSDAWQKNCLAPSVKSSTDPAITTTVTSANVNKLKVDIRLLAELVIVGVWPSEREGLSILAGQLRALTSHPDATMFTPVIINFLKYCGPEFSRLIPRRLATLAKKSSVTFPECKLIPEQFQDGCQRVLKEYLNTVFKKLEREQQEFYQIEAQCLKVLQLRGEIPADEKTKWESGKLDLDRLKNTVATLADLVDEDTPVLKEITEKDTENLTAQQQKQLERQQLLAAAAAVLEGNVQEPPDLFVDENETSFYRKLMEVQPAAATGKDDDDDEAEGEIEIAVDTEDDGAVSESSVSKDKDKEATEEAPKEKKSDEKPPVEEKKEGTPAPVSAEEQRVLRRKKLIGLIESLPNCANRELIDKLAQEFASNGFTGRGTSLRLARALLAAPRTRGYVLPFYARLIATLRLLMPDLAEKVANTLSKEFGYHLHKKDQVKIESKLKTVRFIGELVKFNLFGKPDVLRFLSTLTRDFTFHCLEMLAALLEACGRQLMRWPDTQLKMKLIVDAITRKRASQVLDSRYQLLLDNALVSVKKEEATGTGGFVRELGDPVQLYVINQLARELNRATANVVMRRLRMLDWDDPALYDWLPNVIVSVVGTKLPYSRLPLLASLISAFGDYGYGVIGIRIVDIVLEHLRLAIESPNQSQNQVRLAEARLLGECYNYRLCDSPVILRTLYLLITLGAGLPDIDPPDNLFRIRMACVILDTCGPYFDRGAHKRKLDTYLLYLQLYYWQKKGDPFWTATGTPFPISVDQQFFDTMELLRPGVKLFKSLAEVEKAVSEKEEEMAEYVPKPGDQSAAAVRSGESDEEEDEEQSSTDDEQGEEEEEGDDAVGGDEGGDDDGEEEEADEEEEQPHERFDEPEEEPTRTRGPKQIRCPEDDEFMAELEMTVAAAQSSAPGGSTTLPSALTDLSSNALRAAKAKAIQQVQQKGHPNEVESSSESDAPEVVPFVLVARKGAKPHLAPIAVPKTSALVSGYLKHREAEDAEKAQLKKMILSHQYRQEREEMSIDAPTVGRSGQQQPQQQQQSFQPQAQPYYRGQHGNRGSRH